MVPFQMWLVRTFAGARPVAALMHTAWAWPAAESLHFIGLSLLVGGVGLFDLRLLGLGRRIPIATWHRLIKWGLLGFAINVSTGSLFLLAEPDQYVYNPSFQFKLLFIAIAGANALLFYATSWRRVAAADAPLDAPRAAKLAAVISLSMWIGVIVAGRLLTFHRPFPCEPGEAGFLADCIPGYYDQYRR
jgi:hypothetical protein